MSDFSPAWPHDDITLVFEGIYIVRGTNITHFEGKKIQHSRNMTIIQSHGDLTLINTVRLNEQGLKELDKLGVVKHVISIGAFHGRDDPFYVDRYKATLWTVQPQWSDQSTHMLNEAVTLPIKNARFFMFNNASPSEGFIHLDEQGGIIITCDSIKNWVKVDRFFSEETAKVAMAEGEISKARISPIWLHATGVHQAEFNDLLKLKFTHLISAHGDVLKDTAHDDIENSVKRLVKCSCTQEAVMATIDVDGVTIEVQRKKMKNMTLHVCAPQGNVKISAPLRSSDASIRRFALSHITWIKKHQLTYQAVHHEQTYTYTTGERHFLQGREYVLRVHEGTRKSNINISDNIYIDLFIADVATVAYRQKALMQGYRQLLRTQLEMLIPQWEQVMGVHVEDYQIRVMKACWGTCNPQTRKVCFNLALIKYPTICLEYVIVHEMVHLMEPSHNARFKALMDKFMPDWRKYKAILNDMRYLTQVKKPVNLVEI